MGNNIYRCWSGVEYSVFLQSIPVMDCAFLNINVSITYDVQKSFTHVAGNYGDFGARGDPFGRQFDASNHACWWLFGLINDIFYR